MSRDSLLKRFLLEPRPTITGVRFRTIEGIVNRGALSSRPGPHNMEFSCRPESADHAAVRRTKFRLARLHPGGQLQRFVIWPLFILVRFMYLGLSNQE